MDELFLFDFPISMCFLRTTREITFFSSTIFPFFAVRDEGTPWSQCARPHSQEDLIMPSLWKRIPGVEYSEREAKEALGVAFQGLPNQSLLLLPRDWDTSIKPMRRDETGPRKNTSAICRSRGRGNSLWHKERRPIGFPSAPCTSDSRAYHGMA